MDFDEITKILDMMREHELSEFELERDNFKIRIRKQAGGHWVAAPPYRSPARCAVRAAPLPGVPACRRRRRRAGAYRPPTRRWSSRS